MMHVLKFAFTGVCAIVCGAASSQTTTTLPSFSPPGELEAHSGSGFNASTVYLPGIRFPVERAPAYLNSQVYRPGGSHGGGGGQCNSENYSYPWRDNYCETRGWPMPLCPSGQGHQGVDIRPSSCVANVYWAVAVDDGVIANIGKYSVTLQTSQGTQYRYLHVNIDQLAVQELDSVRKGQRIGLISNHFDGTPTTTHLHFDIKDAVVVSGTLSRIYLPPYTSLIEAYRDLLSQSN